MLFISEWRYYIALLIQGIAGIVCILSLFKKNKQQILLWQTADALLHALGNLVQGGISATIVNLVGAFRNYINAKEKNSKKLNLLILTVTISIGLLINNRGLIGLLPIIATSEYTILSLKSKNAQQQRMVMVLNCLIWVAYDASIQMWTAVMSDTIILVVTLIAMWKNRVKEKGTETENEIRGRKEEVTW